MSAEYFQGSGNEEFEAADTDDIRVLTELAETALSHGYEVLESSYHYECAYGQIVFKTSSSVEDGLTMVEPSISIFGPWDETGCNDLLLEYAFAPNGANIEDYICGDDEDGTQLESYAAHCDIGDICRTVLLEQSLDQNERFVINYFKQLVSAFDASEQPTEAEEAMLWGAITEAMKNKDAEAEHVTIRNYPAMIQGVGSLEVTGYKIEHSPEEDPNYPRFEIELDQSLLGTWTKFIMPFDGDGEPELYHEKESEEVEDDEDIPISKQHTELLSQYLAAALTEHHLIDIAIDEVTNDDELNNESDNPLLFELVEVATLYFNLFAEADEGTEQERLFYDRAVEAYQSFQSIFETYYHLDPDIIDIDSKRFKDELAMLTMSGRNLIRLSIPYMHHKIEGQNKHEIIEFKDGQVVNFHYVETVLCEIDDENDENNETLYRGIGLFGFVEINETFINNPGSGRLPKKHYYPATIPFADSLIISPAGWAHN